MKADPIATAFLLVEVNRRGEPVWSVKWRSADGSRPKKRLGQRAWVRQDGAGGWKPRTGRPRDGELTEFQERRIVPDFVRDWEARIAAKATPPPPAAGTFRELAHAWLRYLEAVRDVKPTTLRDYRSDEHGRRAGGEAHHQPLPPDAARDRRPRAPPRPARQVRTSLAGECGTIRFRPEGA